MRRSKLEMYFDILNTLNGNPMILTHIMYKADVNCSVLKGMLDFLIGKKLIETFTVKGKGKERYRLTENGREKLKTMKDLIGFFEIEIQTLIPS